MGRRESSDEVTRGSRRRVRTAVIGAAGALVISASLPMAVGALARVSVGGSEVSIDPSRALDDVVNNAKKVTSGGGSAVQPRATADDPPTQPPAHETNPHGQGTVAVVDLNPSPNRPYSGDPTGGESGEEVVIGRSRGEQQADGTYHGHITVAALFGNEIVGVDTGSGESRQGPLEPLQKQVLDALCDGSGNQICLSVLTMDSTTTDSGSQNSFSTARVAIGGAEGVNAGVAESNGSISQDANCQTAHGDSQVANASAGGTVLVGLARSNSDSRACADGTSQQTKDSRVLELGGTGVPIPAAGCADGTADTVTGIPTLLPIVCNADNVDSGVAVREALAVFALQSGTSALLKTTLAASESIAVAPQAPAPPAAPPGPLAPPPPPVPPPGEEEPGAEESPEAEPPATRVAGKRAGLPVTGSDVLLSTLAGLVVIASGLGVRLVAARPRRLTG